jgi:hypothetical protein
MNLPCATAITREVAIMLIPRLIAFYNILLLLLKGTRDRNSERETDVSLVLPENQRNSAYPIKKERKLSSGMSRNVQSIWKIALDTGPKPA